MKSRPDKKIKRYYDRTKDIFVIPVTNYQDYSSKYDYKYPKNKGSKGRTESA